MPIEIFIVTYKYSLEKRKIRKNYIFNISILDKSMNILDYLDIKEYFMKKLIVQIFIFTLILNGCQSFSDRSYSNSSDDRVNDPLPRVTLKKEFRSATGWKKEDGQWKSHRNALGIIWDDSFRIMRLYDINYKDIDYIAFQRVWNGRALRYPNLGLDPYDTIESEIFIFTKENFNTLKMENDNIVINKLHWYIYDKPYGADRLTGQNTISYFERKPISIYGYDSGKDLYYGYGKDDKDLELRILYKSNENVVRFLLGTTKYGNIFIPLQISHFDAEKLTPFQDYYYECGVKQFCEFWNISIPQ